MEELMDCPDCGEVPDIKERHMVVGGHMFSGVACDECDLMAMHFNTQKGINLWNEMCKEWGDDDDLE